MTKEELKILIDKLQRRFDFLYENNLYALEMRYVGCRLIYYKNMLKELEGRNNGK